MKIEIYYSHITPAPSFEKRDGKMVGMDTDESVLNYRLVWSGNDRDLGFDYTEDKKTLESVFNLFNRDDEPDNFFGDFRSLSIGDVVCLEDRCYLCQTAGWRTLENFQSKIGQDESAIVESNEPVEMKRGDRIRYFPNVWVEDGVAIAMEQKPTIFA